MPQQIARIELKVPMKVIREGEYFVAFCPALDFSTCGKSLEEAQSMFVEGMNILFEELFNMGTLEDVLLECGWEKVNKPKPHFVPPVIISQTEQQVLVPCPD